MRRRDMACGLWALATLVSCLVVLAFLILHAVTASIPRPPEWAQVVAVVAVFGYLFARLRRVEYVLRHHTHDDMGVAGVPAENHPDNVIHIKEQQR